jgi:ubiquinone/menaquinone biosynthesis C-methylase UbiE
MKLEEVRKNYDRVAKRYDRWTDLVFGRVLGVERLREHTIDLLGDLHGKVVLDITAAPYRAKCDCHHEGAR